MKSSERKYLNERLNTCQTREDRISVYYELASRFYDEDRHSDAIPLYAAALKMARSASDRAYFLAQIGICHYFLKHDKEAAGFLRRADKHFDQNLDDFNGEMFGLVHYYLGAIYFFQGKPERALEEQLIALKHIDDLHRENRWLLHTAISRSCEELGRAEEAVKYNQKAIEVISDDDPNLTYLYESMGDNYFELGQYDEALKAYQKVLDLDPQFERREEIYGGIAQCYQHLTNYRSALDAYQKTLMVKQLTGSKQNLAGLYAEIANCHFQVGDFPAALSNAKEGLRRRSRDAKLKARLNGLAAISLYELGSLPQSIRSGQKALAQTRTFDGLDQVLFRMAMAHHKLGNTSDFNRLRKRCAKSYPDHAWNKLLEKLA